MKQKLVFGLQVFTTLIIFMAIFVTYLERGTVQTIKHGEKHDIMNTGIGSNDNIVEFITTTFTTSFSGVISSDK